MTNDDAPPEPERVRDAAEGAGTRDAVPPSVRIVEAVAARTDRDPTDMPPLHEYVDADALDTLLSSPAGGEPEHFALAFSYDGVEVTVDGDGRIEVED